MAWMRRPWLGVVAVAVAVAVVVVGLESVAVGLVGGDTSVALPARPSSCPAATRGLGVIAFTARRGLEEVDLARCRVSVVAAAGAVDPRFSPNGRWLAYGRGSAVVVLPARGGGVARSPLGRGVVAWAWSPRASRLYAITGGGDLVAALPDGPRRTVARGIDALGGLRTSSPLGISPDGALAAVDLSGCRGPVGELDTVNLRTGARTVVLRRAGRFFTFAGFSPDGRWLLFWTATMCSGSLAADGWPLEAVPAAGGAPVRVIGSMLLYDDFLSWCGSRLIAAVGPDRETQTGSRLVQTGPPRWDRVVIQSARRLSWVSPACAPGGGAVAAAAGPGNAPVGFGSENRSIWLLRPGPRGSVVRRLTAPPAGRLTDEAPRFSRDGRWILFVRSRLIGDGSRDTLELVRTDGTGAPVPIVEFTSKDFSYYDHFEWPYEIAWSASG